MDLDAYFEENPMDGAGSTPSDFKSGFVSLIGRPNAGKSTILNTVLDKKIAITSNTAQTTRTRIQGVLTRDDLQIVLVDTPGLHKPHDILGESLNAHAIGTIDDVDVIAFVLDATSPLGKGDRWVIEQVASSQAMKVCVLNKVDIASEEQIQTQLESVIGCFEWDGIITLSAKTGYKVEDFIDLISDLLPYGPKWFPDDMDSDQSIEMTVAEFIREKILRDFRDEIPHAVGVLVDSFEYVKKKNMYRIFATICIERESQKSILIGKGGSAIKKIGSQSRCDLEKLLGAKVYLDLTVKVKKNWRRDEGQIRRFGYID